MAASSPTVCPKCGHARAAGEIAPRWRCPACGIAYHKYQAYLARARQAVTPPHAGDPAPRWLEDGSIWSLAAANATALAVALWQDWSIGSLMLIYWAQSVIIGLSYCARILALERFSTENFTINDRPVEPTAATKVQVALFFVGHYGLFHAAYLVFLAVEPTLATRFDAWFWACVAAFAINHAWSYRYNRDLDRQGTPNIGTLMMTPYLRIVPMHVMILFGHLLGATAAAVLLFGLLKSLADIGMHLAEHARLKRIGGSRDADQGNVT
jgi:hypothetical protein